MRDTWGIPFALVQREEEQTASGTTEEQQRPLVAHPADDEHRCQLGLGSLQLGLPSTMEGRPESFH